MVLLKEAFFIWKNLIEPKEAGNFRNCSKNGIRLKIKKYPLPYSVIS